MALQASTACCPHMACHAQQLRSTPSNAPHQPSSSLMKLPVVQTPHLATSTQSTHSTMASGIKPWLPALYALSTMIVLPALIYAAVPVSTLRFFYYFVSGSYTFVACWVLLETLVALFSTAFMSGHVHMELDIDQTRKWPEVCYIIPAYLNNEAGILDETMEQFLQLEYAGVINVMIVYNTRGPMPDEEAKLMNAWNGYHIGRMNFYVVNNPGSRSKAQNVNKGLTVVPGATEYCLIMDADHHPARDHTARAVALMERYDLDVLQGACSIRRDSFLSWIIAAEFEDMYNVGHRGRTSLFGIGVFGGSNGCWRRDLLERIGMDHTMLTEDIDSSLRATRLGAKIGYSSYLNSSEEAPATEKTLRKQRLRWAQGWTEVSLKHLVPLMFSPYTSFRQKIGFFTLLGWREIFVYLTLHPLLLLLIYVNRNQVLTLELLFITTGSAIFSVGLVRCLAAWVLARGEVRNSGATFILYMFAQLGWLIYLNWIQVMGHCQAMLGMNAWVPTVRESGGSRDNLHLMAAGAAARPTAGGYPGLKADGGADNVRPEAALECGPFAGRAPRPRTTESHVPSDASGAEYMTSSGGYGTSTREEERVELGVGMERVREHGAPPAGIYDGSSSVATSSL
eukprot:jgi/Ulvmu1/5303/UM022_0097.1